MLNGLETVGGAVNATANIYDGKAGLSDALAFLPLAGFALGKLFGNACFVVGTDVLLEESEPVFVADGGGAIMVPVQSADGRWLWATVLVGLGVVGQTNLNARGARKRQDEEQDAIDLLFAVDDGDADMDEDDLAVAEFARIWPADDVLYDISHDRLQRRPNPPLPSGPAFRLLDRPNVRRDFRAPDAFTSADIVCRSHDTRYSSARKTSPGGPSKQTAISKPQPTVQT